MRHRKDHRKLSRTSSHRRALLRNLVTSLIEHERIETTLAKAKEAAAGGEGAPPEKKERAAKEKKKASPAHPGRPGKGVGGVAPPKTGKTRGRQRGKSGE